MFTGSGTNPPTVPLPVRTSLWHQPRLPEASTAQEEPINMGTIISGPSRLDADINGKTVASVREEYGDVLNIPAGATVTVNAESVDEGRTLRSDDEVVFSKPLGQKG